MENNSKEDQTKDTMAGNEYRGMYRGRWFGFRILAAFGALFLILLVVGFISAVVLRVRNTTFSVDRPGMYGKMMHGSTRRGIAATNQQVLSGVVTSVNGAALVIAGGGTTNTIQTDGNTQYAGGTKPVVNDTVTVFGTTNNGTFTATEITVE